MFAVYLVWSHNPLFVIQVSWITMAFPVPLIEWTESRKTITFSAFNNLGD